MKKLLLIDGNSMLFRAYFATAYAGGNMSTKAGIPTNAIFGFANMLHKAISTIQPDNIMVAFDHDKQTYRHKEYPEYKGTRNAIPEELVLQFPLIREYLDAINITHYEQSGLEADDIIGCLAKQSEGYEVSVLTSDKDLLQIVDDNITVYLMVKGITDIAAMNRDAVYERFTLEPIQIIDLKGLSGDPSDNIPGVTKVGDKTAIKLLNQYGTVENLYEHIDEIKGKLKENLVNDKEKAFLSKHLATIMINEKVDVNIDDCVYRKEGVEAYNFYNKYEMRSLANKVDLSTSNKPKEVETEKFVERKFVLVKDVALEKLSESTLIYYDNDSDSFALINSDCAYNITSSDFYNSKSIIEFLNSDKLKITYDLKSLFHLLVKHNLTIKGQVFDLMVAGFLIDGKVKDIDNLLVKYDLIFQSEASLQLDLFGSSENYQYPSKMASRLFYLYKVVNTELKEKGMSDLYWNVEFPLIEVLFDMENTGIRVDESVLDSIAKETSEKLAVLEEKIYQLVGKQFNINSPKQLGEIIYDDLKLTKSTKRSTDVKVLTKLVDKHPVINEILEYRKYSKIYSTYAFGLKKYIEKDNKIHTVYNQCIAETGRLSSSEPNLQNISARNEEASMVRKAFIPDEGCVLVGADYSQVELRILAHMADEENLISAFNQGYDIHTKTAMDIFGVSEKEVTSLMRRQAKAINFGIDYGMSAFGLSQQLQIPVYMANEFIEAYYKQYPKVREFMDDTVNFCTQNGYVVTLLNRRRDIADINSSNHNLKQFAQRAAMNAPVQGSAADLIKIAMINVYNQLKKQNLKSKMILQIHDELILNVPVEEKEVVMRLVEQEMEKAMELKVPLVAKATCGNDWLEVK